MMKQHLRLLVLSLAISIPAIANAAISPDIAQRSTNLLQDGNPTAALNLLSLQSKTTPQGWFLYGMAAHQVGKLKEAEKAYRPRTQVELQTAYGWSAEAV